ncbi:MAG: ion channel [Saprospiraceae bacterium]|nr:ion channel [Saprospiraceae bacterium]
MTEKHKEPAVENMGFGNKVSARTRLVNDDGSFNIQRVGGEAAKPFEHLVNLPLSLFVLELLAVFLLLNALFATFYFGHGIEHLSGKPSGGWEDFLHCYYFSVQTFTTVGYGYLNPQDHFTNIVSSFNSLIGLTCYALGTGLLIFRLSKAPVKIRFADKVVLSPYGDQKSLQLRLVNAGTNTLINMEASLNMTWLEVVEGQRRRKFQRLHLELDFIYLFPLNWTLIHIIDDKSPFYHKSLEDLKEQTAELLVMVRGYDDTYDQFIYKNHSYCIENVSENEVFLPMYESKEDKTLLYIQKLNDTKKV